MLVHGSWLVWVTACSEREGLLRYVDIIIQTVFLGGNYCATGALPAVGCADSDEHECTTGDYVSAASDEHSVRI
jgi:hypothetical protein